MASAISPRERTIRLITIQNVAAASRSEKVIKQALSTSVCKLSRCAVSASRAASWLACMFSAITSSMAAVDWLNHSAELSG
jgi:hypothetical protein